MNKRQRKKKIKYIVDNIQTINLKENDILVFKVNTNKVNPHQTYHFVKYIQKHIKNEIIVIPVGTDLSKRRKYD